MANPEKVIIAYQIMYNSWICAAKLLDQVATLYAQGRGTYI